MVAEPELGSWTAQPRLPLDGGGTGDDRMAFGPTAFHVPRGREAI